LKQNKKEMTAAGAALRRWFESQQIGPRDGSYVLMQVLGFVLGDMADSENDLEQDLRTARDLIEFCARKAYRSKIGSFWT
jgi:hypothetical protein